MKGSWAEVEPIAGASVAAFYERLFEIDPTTRPLFTPERMPQQHQKPVQASAAVVGALGDFGALLPAIEDLGRRHVGYGVTEAHYRSVGAACCGRSKETSALPGLRRPRRLGRKPMG